LERENRRKIEALLTSFENRVLVLVTIAAIFLSALFSLYFVDFFSLETFSPSKGDEPVVSYQAAVYGQEQTMVAAWRDREGNIHFAKETAKVAGMEVPVLVLVLVNLGLAKAAYDLYSLITGRHRKRLIARYGRQYLRKSTTVLDD